MRSLLSRVFFLILFWVPGAAGSVAGQGGGSASGVGPPAYAAALERLAAGDTAAALDRLREAIRAAPDFGPAYLRLGAVLSARAGEVERDFAGRLEAKQALERAVALLGEDPEALLEYGLLLRRQQIRTDARRVLERAWRAAERRGVELPAAERARLHLELGKIYESWWEDWQDLVSVPPAAQGGLSCAETGGQPVSARAGAVACPAAWAEQARGVVPLADLKSEERARMLAQFRAALEADSMQLEAAARLLGHLADAGAWAEYERLARRLVALLPEDPRPHLFLGLGLHETARDVAADSAFRRALALLPAAERAVFQDIAGLLPRAVGQRYAALDSAGRAEAERVFFASRDPLFLTEAEERRLEHYARLAWAELKFAAPASGLRGWESDRGRIWVRYGRPALQYQCCYGDTARYVYWWYGPRGPVFVQG